MNLALEKRLAEERHRIAAHDEFARRVVWRLREVERALARDAAWVARDAHEIVAEAAVSIAEAMRRDGEALYITPQELEPWLIPLRLAARLTEFSEHEAASTKLAKALELFAAGKSNEAHEALFGAPIT
jgi:hypothetical protein